MTAPFVWPVRVYWEDTDGGGIVYYANYLKFMERARTEWVRALGISQAQLATDPGIVFTVVEARVEYLAPARLDDSLQVSCEPRAEGRVSVSFRQRIWRDSPSGELLAQGEVRVACVAAGSLRPRRLPESIRAALSPS
jgi:acyl-CoA thioester hydrolase